MRNWMERSGSFLSTSILFLYFWEHILKQGIGIHILNILGYG